MTPSHHAHSTNVFSTVNLQWIKKGKRVIRNMTPTPLLPIVPSFFAGPLKILRWPEVLDRDVEEAARDGGRGR